MEMDWSKYIRKKTREELDDNNNIEDFSNNPLITTRTIKEYFDDSNIFITGSTGFLGKVLIEKLLRSCDGVNRIYILLRAKRGRASEQRFEEFLTNKIFDNIREKNPDVLHKLVCVPGDINEPNIGLDDCDVKMLQDRIDIVFHVAATVRFNEPLYDAANLNTFGTQRVMELCTKMANLKVRSHCANDKLLHLKIMQRKPLRNQLVMFVFPRAWCMLARLTAIHICGMLTNKFTARHRVKIIGCSSMALAFYQMSLLSRLLNGSRSSIRILTP